MVVFSLRSLMLLMGLSARTYHIRSGAPVYCEEMILIGAPFIAAARTPVVPAATPMSVLPEITACRVAALPAEYEISNSIPFRAKIPARFPNSETETSQSPIVPLVTRTRSAAKSGLAIKNDVAMTIVETMTSRRFMYVSLFVCLGFFVSWQEFPENGPLEV